MSALTAIGRRLLRSPGASASIGALERLGSWSDGRWCALTYHRVADVVDDGRHPGLISATPAEFGRQLDVLAERFEVVSLDAVLTARAGGAALPPRAVLLTFDDAVDDFVQHTLPALRARGLPAVLFVPTGYVGDNSAWFWWDAVHAAVMHTDRRELPEAPIGRRSLASSAARAAAFDELRTYFKRIPWPRLPTEVADLATDLGVEPPRANVMSWTDLKAAAEAGVAVCPHTRTHPHLDQLDVAEARDEIAGSLEDLRHHLGEVPPAFAYPSGQWAPEVRDVVADLGFELAFTTERGSHTIGSDDPLLVGRLNVSRRTGLTALRLQMHPWADRVQHAGHPVRDAVAATAGGPS